VEVEPLLGDGTVLGGRGLLGPRQRRQRRDGAPQRQRREVQHARRQNLEPARRESPRGEPVARGAAGGEGGGGREQRAEHLEALHAAPPLVELESRLLGPRGRGSRLLRGRRRRLRPARRRCRRGLRRASEDLDHLLEGGGVRLDEGGGEGVGWVRRRLRHRHRHRQRGHRRGRCGALPGGGGCAGVHEKNVCLWQQAWLASLGREKDSGGERRKLTETAGEREMLLCRSITLGFESDTV
jgi:hypothetical protein